MHLFYKIRDHFQLDQNPITFCAFANDYSNVYGGYLVIGIAEIDGILFLPPNGIEEE